MSSHGATKSSSARRPARRIEWIAFFHAASFLVAVTWGFGGQADWLRTPLAAWGSLGLLISLAAFASPAPDGDRRRTLLWLCPLIAFNVFVVLGCLNPSFREMRQDTETVLLNVGGRSGWPSSARPALALPALWLFDAIWITAFNVALIIRRRRLLRALLILAAVNALALAVFGTAQKLSHAGGLYFGAVKSPQLHFFASFVYHNHWGAFCVLMVAAALGLIWHYGRRRGARDFLHSPAFGGLVAIFFLAASVPVSTSRSCTVLVAVLLGAAFLHWLARFVARRRRFNEGIALPLLAAGAGLLVFAAGIWFVARESIAVRVAKTREQLDVMMAERSIGGRAVLYGDTLRMARDKMWYGWGMSSYPHVFTLYNTQKSVDKLPVFFNDAHSDWLQAFAEHGIVGTVLLGLCAIVPLLGIDRRELGSPLPAYLLGGCLLLLLYAWIEFPFGNTAVVFCWWLCFFCALQYGRLLARDTRDGATTDSNHPMRAPPPNTGSQPEAT